MQRRPMTPENLRPPILTFKSAFQGDYWTRLSVIFPIVNWGMFVAIVIFDGLPAIGLHRPIDRESGGPFFLTLAVVTTLVAGPLILWRLRRIKDVFASGALAAARIKEIGFFKGRGRVVYTFSYMGQAYNSKNYIPDSELARKLREGQTVQVWFRPDRPEQAFLDVLFR